MKTKAMSMAFAAIATLTACMTACNNAAGGKNQSAAQETPPENHVLLGKTAKLIYNEFEAEVTYRPDSTLHWKTTNGEGKVAEGDEKACYRQIGPSQFFLSWIEKDGITVSQVIDVKNETAVAFLSYRDDNSERGRRAGDIVEGKWIEMP